MEETTARHVPAKRQRWVWAGRGIRPAATYRGARKNARRKAKFTALRQQRKERWRSVHWLPA